MKSKKIIDLRPPRPLEFHAVVVKPVVDSSMRGLCMKSYHAHPQGCPNYGQRDCCPPAAPLFKNAFDTNHDVWALWACFDIGHHRDKQRICHPTWSPRALVNPRHWQGTVRKFLREAVAGWLERKQYGIDGHNIAFTTCPEAMGVNVTATMQNVGVELEWPPKETTRMIFLAGVRNER